MDLQTEETSTDEVVQQPQVDATQGDDGAADEAPISVIDEPASGGATIASADDVADNAVTYVSTPAIEEAATASAPAPVVATIGRVTAIEAIEGADRIQLAIADCGDQGVWRGVVTKDIEGGDTVLVLLQDALLPADNERWAFMSKHKFRVRMARFKGCRSESVILPVTNDEFLLEPGADVGPRLGITKHEKPIPAEMAGRAKGNFPGFLQRTDEPNFQRVRDLDEIMRGHWEARIKYDGTSGTSFVREDVLRVCSRNLELVEDETNLYWRMAHKYQLQRIPEGLALQFEIIGPNVQGNPLGLADHEIRAFTLYDVVNQCKCPASHLAGLCADLQIPQAELVFVGHGVVGHNDLLKLAEVKYPNGKPGEGIVVRSIDAQGSFKVINLLYKD